MVGALFSAEDLEKERKGKGIATLEARRGSWGSFGFEPRSNIVCVLGLMHIIETAIGFVFN